MKNDPTREPGEEPRLSDEEAIARYRARTKSGSALGSAGKYAGLGFQFAAAILLFLWLGQWVDRKVGTDGPFLLLGVFVGAGAAFYSMYKRLMADQRREEQAERERKGQ